MGHFTAKPIVSPLARKERRVENVICFGVLLIYEPIAKRVEIRNALELVWNAGMVMHTDGGFHGTVPL